MGQAQKKTDISTRRKDLPIKKIDTRVTEELVISLCGAIGAGVSTVAKSIGELFASYGYTISIRKMTDLIRSQIPLKENLSAFERIKTLQDSGNKLRETFGHDYLCQLAIKEILNERLNYAANKYGKSIEKLDYDKEVRRPRRHVTIIENLKNPLEVELLKKVGSSAESVGKLGCG